MLTGLTLLGGLVLRTRLIRLAALALRIATGQALLVAESRIQSQPRIVAQPRDRRVERQVDGIVELVALRRPSDLVERLRDQLALLGHDREALALLDQRARHRVLEFPSGQHQLLGLAQAVLIQGIHRFEPDDYRQTGPRMGREVEIGGIVQLCGAAGRAHELDALRLLALARPGEQQGNAGQAVIVAGLEMGAQHTAMRGRRRLGKRDLGGVVGDRHDRPGVQCLARSGDRQLPRALDGQGRFGAVLPDGREGTSFLVEGQSEALRGGPEVVQLGQHLAAGGHLDLLRLLDRRFGGRRWRCLQSQRRPPGVGRWRDPHGGLERYCCNAVAATDFKGLNQPLRRHATRLDEADQQEQNERGAQGPGIAPRQIGARRPDLQVPHRLTQPLQVPTPQQPGRAVVAAARETIAERAQRLVRQAIDLLQPA